CFSMSPAAGSRRPRHELACSRGGYLAASDRGHDPALLVSPDVVLAAAPGAALLAGAADRHLGLPAELHFAKCRLLCPCRRHAGGCGDPVGHPVPRPAWLLDLLS